MAFKWKTWTAGWLLVICWLMLPVVLVAEEGVNSDAAEPAAEVQPEIMNMFGELNPSAGTDFGPPDWSPVPAPVTIRHWEIRDDIPPIPLTPHLYDLTADVWTTMFDEEFLTDPTTSYIKLEYNAMFSVFGGTHPFQGILFRAQLVQNGVSSYFFGAGEDFAPFISRRDDGSNGQRNFGSYVGFQYVDPDTNTRLIIELKSTDTDGMVSFQNIIVRND